MKKFTGSYTEGSRKPHILENRGYYDKVFVFLFGTELIAGIKYFVSAGFQIDWSTEQIHIVTKIQK